MCKECFDFLASFLKVSIHDKIRRTLRPIIQFVTDLQAMLALDVCVAVGIVFKPLASGF
jgi:ferritin